MNAAAESFTAKERAAMKERARELKNQAKAADALNDLLAKIAEMDDHDRAIAEKVHAIVTATAPELLAKTWYGMPAYASGDKVVCFFQAAKKFGTRYATFGFNDSATLDDGGVWPVAFAIAELTPATEKQIAALVAKATGR
jgi:uncharacterized protein YdhG (YjbR/CyaY superfamily)